MTPAHMIKSTAHAGFPVYSALISSFLFKKSTADQRAAAYVSLAASLTITRS